MKKQISKMIALVIILSMLMTFMPFNMVKAANPTNPKFTLTSTQGKAGDTVTVEVKLNEDTIFEDLTLAVDYDTTKLAVESEDNVILGNNVSGLFGGKSIAREGRVEYQAIDAQGEDTFTIKSGTVLTIKFKILEKAEGTTELSLKYDTTYTKLATSTVKVIVPITGVTLNKTSVELNKGETENISCTISPENTTDSKEMIWKTSNANVATISNGVIKAVGVGNATITVTVGGKTASCNVIVKNPMTGIELSQTEVSLAKGQTRTLKVKYIPQDTTDLKNVTWKSSDNSIATVENGKITALKAGTAKVTAQVGDYVAEATITVVEYPLEGIKAIVDKHEIGINETVKINILTNPENTTDELNVKFISSNENIAKVDENGVITGISEGNASITIIANEKYSQALTIKVINEVVEENNPNEEEKPENSNETDQTDETIDKVEENKTENEVNKQETEVKEETTVLPKTADIAIGAVILVMVISAGIAIFTFKNRKNK